MSRSERRTSPSEEIARLKKRHTVLKKRVAEYEARLTLTAQEQLALQKMKKEKLRTKAALLQMSN